MNTPHTDPAPPPTSRRRFGLSTLIAVALSSALIATSGALLLPRAWHAGSHGDAREDAPKTIYHCPMHPSIVQDHPGDCPICGMKLVPVETPKADTHAGHGTTPASPGTQAGVPSESVRGLTTIEIDPARQQLIGLKTAEVSRGSIGGAWRTVGRVAIDETRVRHINLKIPGFVQRIYVDFVGKQVKKGDPLFSIYSPELHAAQGEYLLALETQKALANAGGAVKTDGDALVASARRKLALWDVPESEIRRISETRQPLEALTFYSPVAGVVTKKDVVEGMKLDAGAMPYEIVDLSSVWVLADVYESELRFLEENMAATLRLNAFPDREFKGKVVFIDPLLDPQTRTVKVRLTFPNPTGELRPQMFGEVVLHGAPHEGLRVPLDAVIDSGTDKVVFVASGEGKFEPRKVQLGASDEKLVEVLRGLTEGERVVTRANFLVDSESRLRASLSDRAAPGHGGHESARVLPATSEPAPRTPTANGPAHPAPPAPHSGH